MMGDWKAGAGMDQGLSEVIGFVLIIGLLVVAFSLYLTYGVPAQGRETEILHMTVVKDQFIDYKIGLDSLLNNDKVGTSLSNSFTLGTEGGFTQGMMTVIPIMSPVKSGGTLSVNRRTSTPETLNITARALIEDPVNRTVANLPAQVNYTPASVFVTISNIQSSDLSAGKNFGTTVNGSSWTAYINLTPKTNFYQYYTKIGQPCPTSSPNGSIIDLASNGCLVPMNAINYTGTDLTLAIKRGNIVTMENIPVYQNVRAGSSYSIDLMDPAYGLSSSIAPPGFINITNDMPLGSVTATGNITYGFVEKTYQISPIRLGAVDYRSQNNYWIYQEYYYQMGGVFLSQVDGNNSYKLPPSISFSYDNPPVTEVHINAIAITSPYASGSIVGGSSPAQLRTTLTSVYTFPFAQGVANAKYLRIAVDTPDDQARVMWRNYFNYTARVAGIPNTESGISGTESYIIIHGSDPSDSATYDISVDATNATYTAVLYGVGG